MSQSPLVSAERLAAELKGEGAPTLLDIRWSLGGPPGVEDYRSAHIPGAVWVDLDSALADPPGDRGRHPLPDPERAAASLREAGVSSGRAVVVYDAKDSLAASRAWWVLRWLGHGDVRVLDGGIAAWVAAGRDTASGDETSPPGDFIARPGSLPVVSVAEVEQAAARGLLLVDARAPQRFRGEAEAVDPVAGHIPGAVNVAMAELIDADGTLRSAEELKARFASVGVRDPASVAAYCGSGVTACHTLLALEVAGVPGAALFPESWSGWITDPAHPIAVGG